MVEEGCMNDPLEIPVLQHIQVSDATAFYSLNVIRRGKHVNEVFFSRLSQHRRRILSVECLDRYGNVIVDDDGVILSKCPNL